jgi:hypothetical protein
MRAGPVAFRCMADRFCHLQKPVDLALASHFRCCPVASGLKRRAILQDKGRGAPFQHDAQTDSRAWPARRSLTDRRWILDELEDAGKPSITCPPPRTRPNPRVRSTVRSVLMNAAGAREIAGRILENRPTGCRRQEPPVFAVSPAPVAAWNS